MATVGLDCTVILDGQGYWVEPDSYEMHRPRVRSAFHNRNVALGGAGVGQRHVDLGPDKRIWVFDVACYNAMRDYSGAKIATTGQTYRDALHTSYQKVNTTLSYTDPAGTVWTVRFVDLHEHIVNLRSQEDGQVQYVLIVSLQEA